MNTTKKIFLLVILAFLIGCVTKKTDDNNVVTRVGFLSTQIMQHPIVSSPMNKQKQFYFDIGEKPNSQKQIIIVYKEGMEIPRERGKKIELKGIESNISLGGKTGKNTYKNKKITLKSWKYLD